MTGSMYAAVSGLKAHMSALNVIGNNVANVNTFAYKATRYTFNEALYTTQISGSDGTNVAGGRNPAQVGFGASIGTIDLDMSTKNYSPTASQLDCMIDGDGFFIVGDKELASGASGIPVAAEDTDGSIQRTLAGMDLSRLGNFSIDPNGYLVDGNGSVVWGFLNVSRTTGDGEDAVTTTETSNILTPIRMPMTDGAAVIFPREAAASADSEISGSNPATQVVDRMNNIGMTINVDGAPATVENEEDENYAEFVRAQGDGFTIDPLSGALRAMVGDEQVTIGYIALAKVTNPNGVSHVDGRYYQALGGAGVVRVTSMQEIDGIESAGGTELITGGLESSGTDLATEITNMITVQRGYQANTRIITVTDSMLEELVNMKR